MTQETRKERRVKIVSLNVRYRSATLEEFIENHAHDVSRGGIFIKATNPFPPGTLLKFEIRLANDQAVIAGVGRVVWKRDVGAAVGDMPSGMGVKFIKLDEPSKAVIDRLVTTKADAGAAFETESPAPPSPPAEPQPVPPSSSSHGGRPPPPPRGRAMAVAARKPTMIGVGATVGAASGPSSSPPRPTPRSTPPPAASPDRFSERPGAPMFPKASSADDSGSVAEPTLMKQAAELLEEALREAGGSLAEVGSNPLFGGHGPSLSEGHERESDAATKVARIVPVDAPSTVVEAEPPPAPGPPPAPRELPKVVSADIAAARAATTVVSARRAAKRVASRRARWVGALAAATLVTVAAGVGVTVVRRHRHVIVAQPVAPPRPPVTVAAAPIANPVPAPSSQAPAPVPPPAPSVPASAVPPGADADASGVLPIAARPAGARPAAPHPVGLHPAPRRPAAAPPAPEPPTGEMPAAEAPAAETPPAEPPPAAPSVAAPPATRPGAKAPAGEVAVPSAPPNNDDTPPAPAPKPKAPKKASKPSDDNPY